MPTIAREANSAPCSIAMKYMIGPATTGKPDSQPATAGPQRRPASVMAPISNGTSVILSATKAMGIGEAPITGKSGSERRESPRRC